MQADADERFKRKQKNIKLATEIKEKANCVLQEIILKESS